MSTDNGDDNAVAGPSNPMEPGVSSGTDGQMHFSFVDDTDSKFPATPNPALGTGMSKGPSIFDPTVQTLRGMLDALAEKRGDMMNEISAMQDQRVALTGVAEMAINSVTAANARLDTLRSDPASFVDAQQYADDDVLEELSGVETVQEALGVTRPQVNQIFKAILQQYRTLLGVKSFRKEELKKIVSASSCDDFDNAHSFRHDFERDSTSDFNKMGFAAVATHLRNSYRMGWLRQFQLDKSLFEKKDILLYAIEVVFRTIQRSWKKGNKPGKEISAAAKERKRRSARLEFIIKDRNKLMMDLMNSNRVEETNVIAHVLGVIKQPACHSEDVSDKEDRGRYHHKVTIPVPQIWRSMDLTSFIRKLDTWGRCKAIEKLNRLLVVRKGNSRRVRRHKTQGGITSVPRKLPINCYDATWYAGLRAVQKVSLAASTRVVDFAKCEAILDRLIASVSTDADISSNCGCGCNVCVGI